MTTTKHTSLRAWLLLGSAMVLGIMSSCQQTENPELPALPGHVSFKADMTPAARSTATTFESGDAIGVFAVKPSGDNFQLASTNFADNVRYVFDGERFQPDGDGIIKEEGEALAYYAVYPYQTRCAPEFTFNVNTDQSSREAYMTSDLCTVSTNPVTEDEVFLKFYHRLSHLVLNVSGFNLAGELDIRLTSVASRAKADLNANSFTADLETSREELIPNRDGAMSYRAIIPPQSIASGEEFIRVSLNGRVFNVAAPSELVFESGREYSFNLNLVNGSVVLSTGIIQPWIDQTVEEEYSENFFAIEEANFVNEEFEEGTDDSDPFEISANQSALAGGMNFVTIQCEQLYEAFELSVRGQQGYWEYFPEQNHASRSSYSYTIPILYGPSFSEDMEMVVCGRKPDGEKSIGYSVNFNYVESLSGDLNINLTFSTPKDVDLHLYTPSGTHIYYGNRGGSVEIDGEMVSFGLDHDSNPACNLDYLNNENIYIPAALIEDGTYYVEVNLYSNCNTSYDCTWSIVARYRGEIIANEMDGGNPVSGVYAPSASSGDHTRVMAFTLHSGNSQQRVRERLRNLKFNPAVLTEAERNKIEFESEDEEEF